MFTLKIPIKYHQKECKIEQYGNWIDLKSAYNYQFSPGEFKLIKLGISMKLPKYFEANIVPRSSTFSKKFLLQGNSYGIVDSEYCGNKDEWMFSAYSVNHSYINRGDRICQFRINISMDAPWHVKLKWLFTNKIKFVEVESLSDNNRGGFGSTGG